MIPRDQVIGAIEGEGCRISEFDENPDHPAGPVYVNPINGKFTLIPFDDLLNDLTVVGIFIELGLGVHPEPFPELEDLYENAVGERRRLGLI